MAVRRNVTTRDTVLFLVALLVGAAAPRAVDFFFPLDADAMNPNPVWRAA